MYIQLLFNNDQRKASVIWVFTCAHDGMGNAHRPRFEGYANIDNNQKLQIQNRMCLWEISEFPPHISNCSRYIWQV